MSAIKKAIKIIGGQTALAVAFGIRQTVVSNWVNRHGQAPAKYIHQISALTNNEVTIEQLLSDHENNHTKEVKREQ